LVTLGPISSSFYEELCLCIFLLIFQVFGVKLIVVFTVIVGYSFAGETLWHLLHQTLYTNILERFVTIAWRN